MRFLVPVLLASLAGCSLSSEGLGSEDPNTSDSAAPLADSSVATTETGAPEDTAVESDSVLPDTSTPDTAKPDTTPPPDTGPPCVETSCGANPTGAKRIGLVDRTIPCPAGFVATDIMEARDGDACSCTCAVTAVPTCPGAGSMPTWYSDVSMTCGTSGVPLASAGNGTCSNTPGAVGLGNYFRATPLAPTGGTCGTTVLGDKLSASRPRRLCESATCGAAICTTPFLECIESATCGGAFPNPRIVGSDINVMCPPCGCTVSGTCTGAVTFYGNTNCSGGVISVPVNDKCTAVPSGPSSLSSFRYVATLTANACAPSYAAGKGTPVVTGQRSLCCR